MSIITLGDHCTPALLLKETGFRKIAYPFDWIAHVDELNSSTMPVVIHIIRSLIEGISVDVILTCFLPDFSKNE